MDLERTALFPRDDGDVAGSTSSSCVTAEEAFACLRIDRTTGYRAIRDGTFPLPVIRVGRLIRVPVAPLRRLLEVGPEDRGEPDGYRRGPTADDERATSGLRLVARPELAHDDIPAASRPGHPEGHR